MRYLPGLGLAVGVALGTSGTAEAQYQGMPGSTIGTPMGYSYGYPNFSSYGSGRATAPPTGYTYGYPSYSSYYGRVRAYDAPVAAPVIQYRPVNPYGYVNRPYYGPYGYGNYSNGSMGGFPRFRMLRGR